MLKCTADGYIFSRREKLDDTPKEGNIAMDHPSPFHMEAAGSLTPELEGAPRSGVHRQRTKAKGRGTTHEARQTAEKAPVLGPEETRTGHE